MLDFCLYNIMRYAYFVFKTFYAQIFQNLLLQKAQLSTSEFLKLNLKYFPVKLNVLKIGWIMWQIFSSINYKIQ